jgi:dTDP-4-dehydrorhamnose 3,5-epimerase
LILQKTHLEGCSVLEPEIFTDKRGSFFESFNKNVFEELTGLRVDFIQDNQSTSRRGVLRGLHIHV